NGRQGGEEECRSCAGGYAELTPGPHPGCRNQHKEKRQDAEAGSAQRLGIAATLVEDSIAFAIQISPAVRPSAREIGPKCHGETRQRWVLLLISERPPIEQLHASREVGR